MRAFWTGLTVAGFALMAPAAWAADACAPTAKDYLGPFYISGTAVLEDLNRFGKPGEALGVSGRVLSAADGHAPVAGARIEVWQTDSTGRYHPEDNGKAGDYADGDIDLRGTVVADRDGRFSFRTVVPGRYPPRARHIHYRVSAPGFRPLVTQHYLSDGEAVPGRRCRSGAVVRGAGGAVFDAPAFYLVPQD
jgi:protocatechuate 3,4-dioxygenase beta subunit